MREVVPDVEVIATFGEIPLRIQQLSGPRGGHVRLPTVLVLLVALGLMVSGVVLFGVQVVRVSRKQAHRTRVQAFLKERGLSPRYAPRVGSSGLPEAGATGLFLLGLFGLVWSAVRIRDERQRPWFTIGEDPRCAVHLPVDSLPAGVARFPLIDAQGSRFVLQFTRQMSGHVQRQGDDRLSLAELGQATLSAASPSLPDTRFVPITSGFHAEVRVGRISFSIRSVDRPASFHPPGRARRLRQAAGAPISLSTAVALGLVLPALIAGHLYPRSDASLEVDPLERLWLQNPLRPALKLQPRDRPANAPQRPSPPQMPRVIRLNGPLVLGPLGPTHRLVDSATHRRWSPRRIVGPLGPRDPRFKHLETGSQNPLAATGQAASARAPGLLGVLQSHSRDLQTIFSGDAAATGSFDSALAALKGHVVGDPSGLSVLGLSDGGRGGRPGCGSGKGGIGFGGWLKNKGGGGGTSGVKLGGQGVGRTRVFRCGCAPPLWRDALGREVIRRVIRRHLPQIRFCYVHHGLTANPRLSGLVKVQFAVRNSGRVSGVRVIETTLGHPATEACIRRAVRRWRFPPGRGRGLTVVGYPFHFRPVGSE